jgi:hypothetical protein
MLDWLKNRVPGKRASLSVAPPSARGTRNDTGQYQQLREYLQDRYANRVVLTFAEIEDLLGFPLPEHARVDQAWWGGGARPSTQSDAWTVAGRIATVNLLAQNVVFERDAALDSPSGRR